MTRWVTPCTQTSSDYLLLILMQQPNPLSPSPILLWPPLQLQQPTANWHTSTMASRAPLPSIAIPYPISHSQPVEMSHPAKSTLPKPAWHGHLWMESRRVGSKNSKLLRASDLSLETMELLHSATPLHSISSMRRQKLFVVWLLWFLPAIPNPLFPNLVCIFLFFCTVCAFCLNSKSCFACASRLGPRVPPPNAPSYRYCGVGVVEIEIHSLTHSLVHSWKCSLDSNRSFGEFRC